VLLDQLPDAVAEHRDQRMLDVVHARVLVRPDPVAAAA
jgi:hypothetical protein